MKSSALLALFGAATIVLSQLTCPTGFYPGSDTVIFTVPYTYAQVTLNGTDNTVGTSRTYDLVGAHVVETLLYYSKPPNGPYVEYHNVALLTVPSANVSFSSPFDFTQVDSVCSGLASTFNFTATFCATNATVVAGLLHTIHMGDAMTVGVFLGGQNFTSCAALGSPTTTSNASSTASPSKTATAVFTGAAPARGAGAVEGLLVAGLASFFALML